MWAFSQEQIRKIQTINNLHVYFVIKKIMVMFYFTLGLKRYSKLNNIEVISLLFYFLGKMN